jgi:hypothetical protein
MIISLSLVKKAVFIKEEQSVYFQVVSTVLIVV